jgi:hypothetical protein
MGPRSIPAVALLVASLAAAAPARADSDKQRAATAFDEGVARFQRAEYAQAARAFDEADRAQPSPTAITNAIQAAKRAGDHLLVARLAQRAIARGDVVVESREALAEASTKLCRLDLACEAPRCAVVVDGEQGAMPAPTDGVFVLPGTHRVQGKSDAGTAEERIVCAPGTTFHVALRPAAPAASSVVASPPAQPKADEQRRGLHPAFHWTGVAITGVLIGVTVWSGVDAIHAKNALPSAPTQLEEEDVRGRARRTDWLLLGAGLAGVGTVLLGTLGTAWPKSRPTDAPATTSFVVVLEGALVRVAGRF